MATGAVKWFNPAKGYGFVQPDDGSKDVFIHISDLEAKGIADLQEDQKISYDTQEDKGKISATNIELIN